MNHPSNPFWLAESMIEPNNECFIFRRSGSEVRVAVRNGVVINWTKELTKEEVWFIEKYYSKNNYQSKIND